MDSRQDMVTTHVVSVKCVCEAVRVSVAGLGFDTENLVLRHIYPFLLAVVMFTAFCIFQARQFKRLYEHIKNDK